MGASELLYLNNALASQMTSITTRLNRNIMDPLALDAIDGTKLGELSR